LSTWGDVQDQSWTISPDAVNSILSVTMPRGYGRYAIGTAGMRTSARRTQPIKHEMPFCVNCAGHGSGLTLKVDGVGVPQL
jgi:hypothetical protein